MSQIHILIEKPRRIQRLRCQPNYLTCHKFCALVPGFRRCFSRVSSRQSAKAGRSGESPEKASRGSRPTNNDGQNSALRHGNPPGGAARGSHFRGDGKLSTQAAAGCERKGGLGRDGSTGRSEQREGLSCCRSTSLPAARPVGPGAGLARGSLVGCAGEALRLPAMRRGDRSFSDADFPGRLTDDPFSPLCVLSNGSGACRR